MVLTFLSSDRKFNPLIASVPSCRNQSIDLHNKSIDWSLYEGNTGTQWVNHLSPYITCSFKFKSQNFKTIIEIIFILQRQPAEVLYKKVFLKISQNSQENNCARVPFLIKLQTEAFFKEQLPVNCKNLSRSLLTRAYKLTSAVKSFEIPEISKKTASFVNSTHVVINLRVYGQRRIQDCCNIQDGTLCDNI